MRLADYLHQRDLKDADFAALVGCDRTTVLRIRRGDQRPSPALMEEIARVTGGQVQPNDYFEGLPEADAA